MEIADMNDHKNGSHGTSVVIFLLPTVSLLTSCELHYCAWNIVTSHPITSFLRSVLIIVTHIKY